ncbi:MAG: hypothetical protein A2W93_14425 [Bacteroidetes bacterium GWF2_43_63]|nr:MAG: hypothetical protein A2W94_00995 [Bacteroidetes bacterium GWE2_42_42]OFY52536.1 MAG: hypothetical protein A2W93_14425 [Bacteroidetes bacterium GWF2_43_63]HBG71444.1 hypothetical protein [Bacteroidales bacterium]HCB60804.1 hypothetical protein [Bacteroidales bacterium]HCY23471.1 hypothetical protein [Bacteroidales bacterium]
MKPLDRLEPYLQREKNITIEVEHHNTGDNSAGVHISPMGCVFTLFVIWFFIACLITKFNLGDNGN